jgi:hypothetical protein
MFDASFAGQPFDQAAFPDWHAFPAERGERSTAASSNVTPISVAAIRAANGKLAALKRGGPQSNHGTQSPAE